MKYKASKNLLAPEFKRLFGVTRETFAQMTELIPIPRSVTTLLGIKNQTQQGFLILKMATPFLELV